MRPTNTESVVRVMIGRRRGQASPDLGATRPS